MKKTWTSLFALLIIGMPIASMAQSTKAVTVDGLVAGLGKPETRKAAVQELRDKGFVALKVLKGVAKNSRKGRDERVASILLAGDIVKLSTAATMADRDGFRKDAESLLATDKDDFVREASALALGKFGDKSAITTLKKSLMDKNANVRMRSAWALAKNGDNSGKDAAIKGLKSNNVTEQVLAVEVLEELGDKGSIEVIRDNLSSDNVWSRINTALAIKRIEYRNTKEDLKIQYLEDATKDKQLEIRNWAVGELARRVGAAGVDRGIALDALKAIAKDPANPAAGKAASTLSILLKSGSVQWSELSN